VCTMLKRILSGLLLTLAFFTFSAIAQDAGLFSGNFGDASGAVVAGTEMTIVNTATNVEGHSRTNAGSIYRVLSALPRNWIHNLTSKTTGRSLSGWPRTSGCAGRWKATKTTSTKIEAVSAEAGWFEPCIRI